MRAHDIPELTHLNIPEKILLIEDLWDSIASEESAMPIPLKHMVELERRWENIRQRTASSCLLKSYNQESIRENEVSIELSS